MIKTIGEFEKLLKLCRKQGVTEVKLGDISFSLGELPKKRREDAEDVEIETDELTPDQLAFYSSGGPINENHQI